MKILFAAQAAVITLCLASLPVAAQEHGIESSMPLHAFNPSESLSAPTSSPFADQMRENYAATLSGAQRELLQQNPSGDTRQEEEIGRELNGYVAPR
jgi:photosystem II stability/assembly factor-like uncharacterized protein